MSTGKVTAIRDEKVTLQTAADAFLSSPPLTIGNCLSGHLFGLLATRIPSRPEN